MPRPRLRNAFHRPGSLLVALSAFGFFLISASFDAKTPPVTAQKPVTDTWHGVAITDPYRWLEDQQSPETRAWIAQQQKYMASYLSSLSGRQQARAQLTKLMRVDSYDLPTLRGERQFFTRKPASKDQNQLCVRENAHAREEVLVDANSVGGGKPATVRLMDVSQDGRLLAYGIQEGGQDEVTLHLYDVTARRDKGEPLGKARFMSMSLLPDNSGFYYTKALPEGSRVFFHKLGRNDMSTDPELFGKGYGPEKFVDGSSTYDGRWLLLRVGTGWGVQTDIYAIRLGSETKPRPIAVGLTGAFEPDYSDNHLFVTTTWKAPNQRILNIDLNHPDQRQWKEVIPERQDHIESAHVIGGKLVVTYLHNVASQLRVYSLEGKPEADVSLPSLGTVEDVQGRPDHPEMFYSFTSFAYAPTNYQYSVTTHQQSTWWKPPVVGHPSDVVVQQVWYESKDQTKVPMFLVHRKDFKQDGSARTLMTAYGGFDVSLTPMYQEEIAYWVEQGGLFALPNLRGGAEFGEAWHHAGMFGKKQNVFDDFESAAAYLEKNNYTRASRLGIEGMSNGGLLMGAAVTQRPDLFGAVVCEYPLLDMVRFDKFKVAKWWTAEYGSAENKDQFPYLYKYSPYHHVEKGRQYPAVLFITGDGDTRVDPLHARKMTALMQASNASARPILLKYDTTSGHSGGKPTAVRIEDATDVMLFLQHELN